jgi:hypothetical protein
MRSSGAPEEPVLRIRRTRPVLSLGLLAGACALLTAGLGLVSADVVVELREDAGFDLQAAAGAASDWSPRADDWQQGNPVPITLSAADDANPWTSGSENVYTLAVRSSPPDIGARLCAELAPRAPDGTARADWGGSRVRLTDDHGPLITIGPHTESASRGCSSRALEPGEVRRLRLRVDLPDGAETTAAPTGVLVTLEGESR